MLSRAALPLMRHRAIPTTIRLSYTTLQSRYYAKNHKPHGYDIPSSAPSSSSHVNPSQKPRVVSQPPNPSKPKDFSEEQTEFESNPESQQNEAPQSTGAGAGVSHAQTGPSGAGAKSPEFSNNQTEFETESRPTEDASESQSVQQPQQPLPDLTQGIPSTIAEELAAKSRRRGPTGLNLTEDPEKGGAGDESGGGGDIPKNAYVSSLDRRRTRLANLTYAIMLSVGLAGTIYLGRDWATEEEEKAHPDAPSGWGFGLFFNRIKARFDDLTSYYKDPAFEKLLPEEDPALRQPYTLVLSLEDLLVHSEWTREHGWRVAKRPGVDYFLRYLNQYYELVLFTTVPSMMADQVLRKLDPYRIIRWPLFREATKYEDGEYVKDLSYLNRDLSKVILIDTHEPHAKRQPENAIILPKWNGDPKDRSLVALIPFLEYVAGMGMDDVRTVLKSFEGTYIPAEFARREKIMREKFEQQLAEERAKRPKHSIGSIASLFGIKPMGTAIDGLDHSTTEGLEQGKMLWDQIRERGQKQYQLIEKEIQENGEKWLAEMAAEEEKMRDEQMKGMKNSFTSFFGGGGQEKK
ncbi:mitochondrial inner membrane protein required for protein import [Coccidioides posadasii str. Silveira]|uniref:Mitochondrial import inner membrane translocase subunit TIM50 n=2 Tax=Coccidioides posadasii TaxID=199306 RepID=E9D967_COCPS|nr:NLI interacting factor-like phosphatase family protein [Coccidioides posadasii C735 delta SOWgp]EER29573.1 NLI interacting factor-like phosphatase family protein [Coccidioides posadasii C735 delta SOWgp]EFW17101.1 import inner membrane translocase subunit tim-50 [Coccidioides posadasii str. Silveira]QVM09201.1 mitochondrial inner membrane protein required for protein import [Coccidioides posadasii str. Silveira]|eukprot:XP_003071718.1 NLI interacting factor-like phosphatase family protein [Coccidioides posadasii C735 delta SOWgp]